MVGMEELDDLESTQAIVARIQRIDEESKANEDSDEFENFLYRAASLLQGYVLQQGLSNEVWRHMDALAAAVEKMQGANAFNLPCAISLNTLATISSQK